MDRAPVGYDQDGNPIRLGPMYRRVTQPSGTGHGLPGSTTVPVGTVLKVIDAQVGGVAKWHVCQVLSIG
ncbi:MAG: hypothetical protein J2P15_15220 [Micromonosporaceae bacterium]|nr:hypothetical protein [Micromonosporaceae bacterium]